MVAGLRVPLSFLSPSIAQPSPQLLLHPRGYPMDSQISHPPRRCIVCFAYYIPPLILPLSTPLLILPNPFIFQLSIHIYTHPFLYTSDAPKVYMYIYIQNCSRIARSYAARLLGKTDMSFDLLINSTRGSRKGPGDPYLSNRSLQENCTPKRKRKGVGGVRESRFEYIESCNFIEYRSVLSVCKFCSFNDMQRKKFCIVCSNNSKMTFLIQIYIFNIKIFF